MELAEALSLVVFYSGAFFMPLLAARVHVPASVAEILFGLIIGGLGVVHESTLTEFLAELGFIYLMFLVGMEIDFNRIEREGRTTVFVAFVVAASVLGSAGFIGHRLGLDPFLGLVLGAMSVGVLMVALVDVNASQTRWGQIVLLVGSIGEFLTLMTLTGYDLVERHGIGWELVVSVAEVSVLFAVAFVLLLLLRLGVWWFPHSFQRWVSEEDPSELGVRFGFVLMLGLTTVAIFAGMESILGAFLAGTLFGYVFRETGVLETKLAALGQGFFVPIFFIHVGVNFDWTGVRDLGVLGSTLVVLAGASLVAKMVPSLLLIALGLPVRAVVGGAFLLATPLTLLVAIAALGTEMGAIDTDMAAAIVILAIVTGVLFPTLFKLIAPRTRPTDLELERNKAEKLTLRNLHIT
jgi:Kef-type K+ transport system membrane component KefB